MVLVNRIYIFLLAGINLSHRDNRLLRNEETRVGLSSIHLQFTVTCTLVLLVLSANMEHGKVRAR